MTFVSKTVTRKSSFGDQRRQLRRAECYLHEGVMHREQALGQRSTHCVKPDPTIVDQRDIVYLDAKALTRNCIARELARRLPEFNVLEYAEVQDLIASEEARLRTAAVAILYIHAERFGRHADGEPGTSYVPTSLSLLEQMAPAVPRVLLSEVEVPEHILEAFHQHIRGYVPTTWPIDQVAEAIRFVAAGGTFVPQSILSLHIRSERDSGDAANSSDLNELIARFSPRQSQVLRMLWKGCSNKLIAYELRMCESTVKVHIRHIMKKLNVSNRTQVALKTRPHVLSDNRGISLVDAAGRNAPLIERSPATVEPDRAARMLLGRLEKAGPRGAP